MRNWSPYLTDAVGEAKRLGLRRGLSVVLAPHRSQASFGRYVKSVEEAQERAGATGIGYEYLDAWHDHPLFIGAHAAALEEAIKAAGLKSPGEAEIVFTAHSIPVDMARASAYESEMRDTAARVAKAVRAPSWTVAWQSASTHGGGTWLEPDILSVIRGISVNEGRGTRDDGRTMDDGRWTMDDEKLPSPFVPRFSSLTPRKVVVVPIGFLCDNAEILYDLDVEARQAADSAGVRYFRARTVLNHPNVIEMFTQLIKNKIGERSIA
jgi:ferrochelatase